MSDDTKIRFKKRILTFAVILLFIAVFTTIYPLSFLKLPKIYNTLAQNSADFVDFSQRDQNAPTLNSESLGSANQDVYVHIGGEPIGIAIGANGLIVMSEGGISTVDGEAHPARDAGIQAGDVILSINGENVTSIYRLKKILSETTSKTIKVVYERDGRQFATSIAPAEDKITGQKKLGLALKEDVGGVGTLTFVTQEGQFAALGHHIADAESGLDEELNGGYVYKTEIEDVIKGEVGKAGGLVASVNRLSNPIGTIKANTHIGLYGEYTSKDENDLVRIALKGEAQPGHAQVLTTVEGETPKFYDIEIVKVISQSEAEDKGMVILVSDKELLKKTGGIVQGMSGSPILQNGALVGAVTHVFIQDPTRGYAVHARFMLDEASKISVDKNQENDNLKHININDIKLAA